MTGTDPPARPGRRTFVMLGGLSAFAPLSIDLYLPSLPRVAADLHAGQTLTQATISTSLVGLALGQLIAGPVSDRLGRRRPLLIGMVSFVVMSLVCAAAPNIVVLIVARLLQGTAGAAGLVIARAMVRDLYGPIDAGRVFAQLTAISGLAPILAPLLGAQLLKIMPWPGLFVTLAGLGAVLLLGATTLPESLPAQRRRRDTLGGTLTVGADLLRSRTFVGFVLAAAQSTAALLTYISASPFVLQDGYGLSAQAFSLAFAVNSAGIIVFGQIGARLTRRVGSGLLLATGLVLQTSAAIGVLLTGVSGARALFLLLVPLFVLVASVGLVGPHATSLALAPHPDVAGSASAIIGAAQFSLAGVLSPLGGLGERASALPLGLTISVISVVGVGGCAWLTRPPRRGRWRTSRATTRAGPPKL